MTKPTTPSVASPAVGTPRTSSEMLGLRLPDDVQDRLRAQARHGAAILGVVPEGAECVWGWQGSSLSLPVLDTSSGAQLWMKLRSRPALDPLPPLWSGVATAERVMTGLPVLRPVLLTQRAWSCGDWAYQVELTSRMPVRSFSLSRAAPEWVADLPTAWWTDLRAALDNIQGLAPAGLATVAWQEAAARSVGTVDPASWVPSHGDLCWANLGAVGDQAVLFDWDYIGRGPRFADAAGLLLSSLDTPDVAARIMMHFGDQLDSPEGLYAQSVIGAHWTRRIKAGEHVDLAPALRAHIRTVEKRVSPTGNRWGATVRCAPC